MRVIDRLELFLAHRKITAYSFEKNCRVANGYLKKQLKGKGSVGSDILFRIYRLYPELNFDWLMTGEGQMLRPDGAQLPGKGSADCLKNEILRLLQARISLLESAMADKDKIICMLEDGRKNVEATAANSRSDFNIDPLFIHPPADQPHEEDHRKGIKQ